MARIFRQRYTVKTADGTRQTRKSKKWYVEFVDAAGIRRRVPGYADKQATQQLASELERRAAREQSGLVDRFAEHRKRPLSEHVDDFRNALVAKGTTEKHANLVTGRVRRTFEGCRFVFWPDISASRLQSYIAELHADTEKKRGISIQTCNFYLQAAKQFCRFMVRDGRAPNNPLEHLQGGNVRTDRRHDRRALTVDELRGVLEAAQEGPERFGMTGPDRANLYQLAAETGLRASELRSLTWASFDLDGAPPTVTVRAAYAKGGRDDTLPLKLSMASLFTRWRAGSASPDSGSVFPTMPLSDRTASLLRADLSDARAKWIDTPGIGETERKRREQSKFLAYRDDAGRVADFHALRHTFATFLADGGVHPKQAQDLVRHSDINLTMTRYTHTLVADRAAALSALPDLSGGDLGQQQRATGTYDAAGDCLPTSLPTPAASIPTPAAPVCSQQGVSWKSVANVSADGTEACRTSLHPSAPHSIGASSKPPDGLEPSTCGLQNRCSSQLSYGGAPRRCSNGSSFFPPGKPSLCFILGDHGYVANLEHMDRDRGRHDAALLRHVSDRVVGVSYTVLEDRHTARSTGHVCLSVTVLPPRSSRAVCG